MIDYNCTDYTSFLKALQLDWRIIKIPIHNYDEKEHDLPVHAVLHDGICRSTNYFPAEIFH